MVELAAAGAIIGAAASIEGVRQQNDSIRSQNKAAGRAGQIQSDQLSNAEALEREKINRQQRQIVGALRVASAESGVSLPGSSFEALQAQAAGDARLNAAIVGENVRNQRELIRTGVQANAAELESRTQNQLLRGLLGGIQGGQAGLQIAGGFSELQRLRQQRQQQSSGNTQ